MADEPGELEDAEEAVAYWRRRWAEKASQLTDAIGIIHDLCRLPGPGAIHRALIWLQKASGLQGDSPDRVSTWAEYERWLGEHWPGRKT